MAKGEVFTGLPKWAQGIIAVAVVGGVGFVLWKLYQKGKDVKGSQTSRDTANSAKQEAAELAKSGMKLSFPESSYNSTINTVIKLLNGCETFGSEGQAINEIAKVVKNKLDWTHLVALFGSRDLDDCGWGKTNYDLPTLLKDQLDTSGAYSIDVNGYKKSGFALNSIDILDGYLKSKGIQI